MPQQSWRCGVSFQLWLVSWLPPGTSSNGKPVFIRLCFETFGKSLLSLDSNQGLGFLIHSANHYTTQEPAFYFLAAVLILI